MKRSDAKKMAGMTSTESPVHSSPSPDLGVKIGTAQRKVYLRSKGIAPDAVVQLDLAFPDSIGLRDDLRHLPNDYARSSLFTVRNRREARRTFIRHKLFHYNEHVTIFYTGIELRAEDDELVWLQIMFYSQSVPMGDPFEFSISQLLKDLDWKKNGRNYERARECISRLKANEILVQNSKAYGTSGATSLIRDYTSLNDSQGEPTQYRVWIDSNLIDLFAGNTFTSHAWPIYRLLSPTARRLADNICSHRNPLPLALETYRTICDSGDESLASFKQTAKKACEELLTSGLVKTIGINNKQMITCIRA